LHAGGSGLDASAYVGRLLDDPERVVAAPVSELPLADVSRLAGVLGLLPEEVRRSRSELGRVFGLLKHFFEMPATATNAEQHAFAMKPGRWGRRRRRRSSSKCGMPAHGCCS